jgi:hypothetical protein
MTIWEARPAIPRGVAAALAALRFEDSVPPPALSDAEWARTLAFCDRAHLTLPLGAAAGAALPESVRTRIEGNLARNRERAAHLLETWDEVAAALASAGIEAAVLKGFSHWGEYTGGPATRLQYDLDLYAPHAAAAARDAVTRLGYTPVPGMERAPTDHLPALVRQTGWRWTGDFFDPAIPFAVEVHFRLWDERTEAFPAPGLEAFWERRVERTTAGRRYLALHPADAFGYAALHALRHMLRGDLRAGHIYELAWFLHQRRADDAFWNAWRALHGPELRGLEAIAIRLAREWFGCGLHPAAREAAGTLPAGVERWFARSAAAPVEALFRPNKDELALHLCLLGGLGAKARVLRRRLVPAVLPHMPEGVGGRGRYLLARAAFHLQALSTMLRTRR